MIYTWATLVAAIVPDSVSGGTAQFAVTYRARPPLLSRFRCSAAPGIFTQDRRGGGTPPRSIEMV